MLSGRTLLCCCVACLVFLICFSIPETQATEAIQLWYGEEQQFGFPGLAQPRVNIFGRINNHDQVSSLSFSVNEGGEQPLHIGPDSRRLSAPGDFNVEIDAHALQFGNNSINITRILKDKSRDVRHVTVNYQSRPWPLPYRVEWAEVDSIQNAVQVVDGMWEMTKSGIRTAPDSVGYDRALALGDEAWSSYEILVPVTLNGVDSSAYDSPESVRPGLGLILHWNGHTDSPIDCGQPHCGWFPVGAIHWYTFPKNGPGGFAINTRPSNDLSVALPYVLEVGKTYLFRSRVKTFPLKTHYFMKVWPQGEEEPAEWSLQQTADRKNPDHGGVLIVAHHVDLTLGNIAVQPIFSAKSVPFREYLTILPQVLSMAAAFLFLCVAALNKKFRDSNKVSSVAILLIATVLLIYLEPLLPVVLQQYPVTAAMSAALYLGYDVSSVFLQFMIWIIIFSNYFKMFRKKYQESMA
ncbi:MAG: hypothetical protein KKA76_10515 [Proteobacteria bacterium]|nr:hypothetical protein [Pseudomonadota bacterium]